VPSQSKTEKQQASKTDLLCPTYTMPRPGYHHYNTPGPRVRGTRHGRQRTITVVLWALLNITGRAVAQLAECPSRPCNGTASTPATYQVGVHTLRLNSMDARFSVFGTGIVLDRVDVPAQWNLFMAKDKSKFTMRCNAASCDQFKISLMVAGGSLRAKTTGSVGITMSAEGCTAVSSNFCSCGADACFSCTMPNGQVSLSLFDGMSQDVYGQYKVVLASNDDRTTEVRCACVPIGGACSFAVNSKCTVLAELQSQWPSLNVLRTIYDVVRDLVANLDCATYAKTEYIADCVKRKQEILAELGDADCVVPQSSTRMLQDECADIEECRAVDPLCTGSGQLVCRVVMKIFNVILIRERKKTKILFKPDLSPFCNSYTDIVCRKQQDLCALWRGANNCNRPNEDECFGYVRSDCFYCCNFKAGQQYGGACAAHDSPICTKKWRQTFSCPCTDKSACGGGSGCVFEVCKGPRSSSLPQCT
jgi:hypothetical protein